MLQHVLHGWPSSKPEVASELHTYFNVQAELSVAGSGCCLLRGSCVTISTSLRQQLLELAYEGHLRIMKSKCRLRFGVWWPGRDSDLERFVRYCTPCMWCLVNQQSRHRVLFKQYGFRRDLGGSSPLDIAGEFVVASSCHRFMIVAIDYISKWPEGATTCSSVTSGAVIEFLNRLIRLFDRFGLVEEIVADDGSQFASLEFEAYLKALGIRHSLAALYSPQSNSEVEGRATYGQELITAVRNT